MIPMLDNSLTIVQPAQADLIDYETFQDLDRHFIIRDRHMADAFQRIAATEAAVRRLRVGSKTSSGEVEFYVFDLIKDRQLRQRMEKEFSHSLRVALEEAMHAVAGDGSIIDQPKPMLDELGDLIALRRFLANAAALGRKQGSKAELLFHHVTD